MKKKEVTIMYNPYLIASFFFLFAVLIFRVAELSLFTLVDGRDLSLFAETRNTTTEIITAQRGTIYDSYGDVLSQNVNSYTLIAYLEESRTTDDDEIRHVIDKEATAKALSPLINMTEEDILELLENDAYQVELGPGGRGIGELLKEEIEDLNLPGLDFVESSKRYYPNNDFASYVVGYAKQDSDGTIIGELGIEQEYDDLLSGTDGYTQYQQDNALGYQIPNTPEIVVEAEDGADIYLTINSNVQFFAEQAIMEAEEEYDPEWMVIVVADAKTGAILASASTPSFDPNVRDIESYLNPLVSFQYEPGSTMKTYTYMAAIEKGVYDGDELFTSGELEIYEDLVTDWNPDGWGDITLDHGFSMSANTGIATITENYLSGTELKSYFQSLGFGSTTDINLPNEKEGYLGFTYPLEIANAGFGQGITTTPIQNIKALTSISNNGKVLNPYLVEKIIDPNTNEIIYQGGKSEGETVASDDTITEIKDLLDSVVNGDPDWTTGEAYHMDGYDIIGKTGTAQISSVDGTGYLTGYNDYIYSFSGMYPKDDPEILIYVSASRPDVATSKPVVNASLQIIEDTAKYFNIFGTKLEDTDLVNYVIDSYINKSTTTTEKELENQNINVVTLGSGDKVINQYPIADTEICSYENVILLTNSNNIYMPDLKSWAYKDVIAFLELIGVTYEVNGYGFVTGQSIEAGQLIDLNDTIIIELEEKDYFEEEE